MNRLQGKVCIVTGGGGNIGSGICRLFADEGAVVVPVGRTFSKLQKVEEQLLKKGAKVLPIQCDCSKLDQVQKMVKQVADKYGKIDVLVNCASDTKKGPDYVHLEDGDDDWWNIPYENGPKATWYCMKTVFPYLKEKGGRVINFGSSSGVLGASGRLAYTSAKEAIRAITRSAAREWAKYRINVTTVLPLAMGEEMIEMMKGNEKWWNGIVGGTMLKRMGTADKDIAPIVVFLASDESCYVTGTSYSCDGGWTQL